MKIFIWSEFAFLMMFLYKLENFISLPPGCFCHFYMFVMNKLFYSESARLRGRVDFHDAVITCRADSNPVNPSSSFVFSLPLPHSILSILTLIQTCLTSLPSSGISTTPSSCFPHIIKPLIMYRSLLITPFYPYSV